MESGPDRLKHRALTEKIIGAFYDVYNELGHGFLEVIYERALAIALARSGMKVEGQVPEWFRSVRIGDFRAEYDGRAKGIARTQSSADDRSSTREATPELFARHRHRGWPASKLRGKSPVSTVGL
jgi:hypothetical protein